MLHDFADEILGISQEAERGIVLEVNGCQSKRRCEMRQQLRYCYEWHKTQLCNVELFVNTVLHLEFTVTNTAVW